MATKLMGRWWLQVQSKRFCCSAGSRQGWLEDGCVRDKAQPPSTSAFLGASLHAFFLFFALCHRLTGKVPASVHMWPGSGQPASPPLGLSRPTAHSRWETEAVAVSPACLTSCGSLQSPGPASSSLSAPSPHTLSSLERSSVCLPLMRTSVIAFRTHPACPGSSCLQNLHLVIGPFSKQGHVCRVQGLGPDLFRRYD